jgi:nucleoside-diphosphate-sugar epimerase
MKIAITGGSGFIGTNIISKLLSKNVKVINLDIVRPRNCEHEAFYEECDITDYGTLEYVLDSFRPDAIIHLAARTDLLGASLDSYDANILGVENICRYTSNSDSIRSIIFTSSMLVCKAGFVPRNNFEYCPTTIYGESKVEGEKIVKKYSSKLPPFAIIRPTSIWGPWFSAPYKDFFDMVLNGSFFSLGDKSCNKTYGFVGNSVNQILSLLDNISDNINTVFYIGDSPFINISNWADLIASKAGVKKPMKLPFFIFKYAAVVGDILKVINVNFPFSSFRLNNMTTDNVFLDLPITRINEFSEIDVEQGVDETLIYINSLQGSIK